MFQGLAIDTCNVCVDVSITFASTGSVSTIHVQLGSANAYVAQLVERDLAKVEVRGFEPHHSLQCRLFRIFIDPTCGVGSIKNSFAGIAQWLSVPGFQPGDEVSITSTRTKL
jgi:hypothetical protein